VSLADVVRHDVNISSCALPIQSRIKRFRVSATQKLLFDCQMASNTTKYAWAPAPEVDFKFEFTSCAPIEVLWKLYMTKHETNERNAKIYSAILDGLGGYLRSKGFGQPPLGEVLEWIDLDKGAMLRKNLRDILEVGRCKHRICAVIGWEGTPDIAGQGV
jgi:hypothetical protein